jgi:hypothetical protein
MLPGIGSDMAHQSAPAVGVKGMTMARMTANQ